MVPKMQDAAAESLREGLAKFDGGRGWRDTGLSIDVSGDWQTQLRVAALGTGFPDWKKAVVLSKSGPSARIGFSDGSTGYLPESPPLYPEMTVRDYLDFVARIKRVPAGERTSRVNTAMERARVTDMAARHCGKLSKGYRQRVGLAQALLHNPDVLVLDEPTAGLDPKQIIETRQLIHELAGDHTIILSTHILPEVAQTCRRVVIINKGRVVAVDSPENLTRQLRGAETMYVLVDGGDAGALLQGVAGVTRVAAADQHGSAVGYEVESTRGEDVRRDLARAVVSHGLGLLELRPMRMSLEEIFLQVTTEEETGKAEPAEEATA
jgi:ABC-2 type transport system ATP-binding protein